MSTKVDVLNWKKEKVGGVDLSADIFSVEVRKDILHTVVNWQLASRRQGTAMVKTRSLVSGGGKKPFKQKGTGNARQGSTRSPLMPGGAKLFGPIPRSYAFALPKKVRVLGLKMALSHLHKEGKLFIIDNLKSDGKTAELAKRLKAFGLAKAVLVDAQVDEKFKRASNNLPKFKYFPVEGLNVFDLLKYDAAVISKDSIAKIVARLGAE
jgi:large subunit ribosomal protein L4